MSSAYSQFKAYLTLCKPRVVLLMLLTAWAGMYLAAKASLPWWLWVNTTIGIAFLSGAAATANHIVDQRVDAKMERTKKRPLVSGKLPATGALIFASLLTLLGFPLLYFGVNHLTAYLTLLTALGYSAVYSLCLKRATSQNIVIGGLSGAMPPLLGWTAATGHLAAQGWLLVLIIFAWTPAHFWALCIHRINDYRQANLPMLPVTHGVPFTKINIVLYSLMTVAASLLPYGIGMSGSLYLLSALVLGAGFMFYALKLQFAVDDTVISIKAFRYSLIYLTGIFTMILLDHFCAISF